MNNDLLDTSKPPNVLVMKISLKRLKNIQKLSVYGKFPHRAITWRSLYFTLWNLKTKANSWSIDISKHSRAYTCLKNNYGQFNILPVLSKLFERLPSKQLAESFERILSKCLCGLILGKIMVCNIVYKWCLKLEKSHLW